MTRGTFSAQVQVGFSSAATHSLFLSRLFLSASVCVDVSEGGGLRISRATVIELLKVAGCGQLMVLARFTCSG